MHLYAVRVAIQTASREEDILLLLCVLDLATTHPRHSRTIITPNGCTHFQSE